ncbi:erg24, C-14 sterol reductase [Coemansia spiralis]|uniref:Delta(14)-sterol reductase n=2 Tax=Coemansia TaxID=4863 RepID=A0A9W8GDB7_9FUNG|nr:ergosterol biosynthesis ERG4/ERG24 [Coemansia spiralis]KAJ1988426.1 erg24, C-14 sterol reductase [Coemansia umbellata]KAJ2621081.1 erg24, C-14 sterol reductase [Coemansia sp. RSA 1358]KAJ2680205.1 erg24, C-14 sterol reductase [Coemansia spiralis]
MDSKNASKRILNPKTTHREFFGVPGSAAVMLGTPAVVGIWYFSCNEKVGCQLPTTRSQWSDIAADIINYNAYLSSEAITYYALWWSWLVMLCFVIPCSYAEGTLLRNGERLRYPINGLSSLLVTTVTALLAYANYGTAPYIWIADHFFQLAVASLLFSTAQALFVYLYSFRRSSQDLPAGSDKKPVLLALAGNSGNPIYDFFIGRELNPRVSGLDLKVFNELRPGIMGWILLNVSFAIKQHHQFGALSNSMWLAIIPQIWYCIDTLLFETKVLTTMDVTTDGFGWMLSFGDLTWVPCMYSLQARYLSFHPVHHPPVVAAFIAVFALVSFLVFRLSNSEKNAFRANPSDPAVGHLKYITTESGSKLLVSGWWGMARHINYTGDWMYGLAQCLATGFETPMTYFFSAYFLVLLLHRNYRDECKCRDKYKKDWDRYCELVPYMFIPHVI